MRLVASVVPSAVHQMSNPGHVGARLVYLHFRDANPSARAHVDVGLGLAGRPFGGANSTPGRAYGRVVCCSTRIRLTPARQHADRFAPQAKAIGRPGEVV
jgi:hypothetical protein